jgi:hypothetical protein
MNSFVADLFNTRKVVQIVGPCHDTHTWDSGARDEIIFQNESVNIK